MSYPTTVLPGADTRYHHNGATLALRRTRYACGKYAALPDDGIVDDVAVERAVFGDATVRLSGRELACAIFRLAVGNHLNDGEIADRLRMDADTGRDWVTTFRARNAIPAAEPVFDDDQLWRLMGDTAARAAASPARLVAAGITA